MKEGLRLMYQAQNQCIQQMTYWNAARVDVVRERV